MSTKVRVKLNWRRFIHDGISEINVNETSISVTVKTKIKILTSLMYNCIYGDSTGQITNRYTGRERGS